MATCLLCGIDLSRPGIGKIPGRRCCHACASALFDAAHLANRVPSDFADPLIGLRDEIKALAEKASAASYPRRTMHLDYSRGQADAHNYDVALVLYAMARRDQQKKDSSP